MEPKDCCVICKAETKYPVSTPIEGRQHYVVGSGQLCAPCCKRINACDGNNCPAAYF